MLNIMNAAVVLCLYLLNCNGCPLRATPVSLLCEVFVPGSNKQGGLGRPFGYLKPASTGGTVNLIILAYDYPQLNALLSQFMKVCVCRARLPFRLSLSLPLFVSIFSVSFDIFSDMHVHASLARSKSCSHPSRFWRSLSNTLPASLHITFRFGVHRLCIYLLFPCDQILYFCL